MDDIKITGALPNMTMELSHSAEADGSAEHIVLRLTATPNFQSALPLLDGMVQGLPMMMTSLLGQALTEQSGGPSLFFNNPWMTMWSDMARTCMAPWLSANGQNPFLPFGNGGQDKKS